MFPNNDKLEIKKKKKKNNDKLEKRNFWSRKLDWIYNQFFEHSFICIQANECILELCCWTFDEDNPSKESLHAEDFICQSSKRVSLGVCTIKTLLMTEKRKIYGSISSVTISP